MMNDMSDGGGNTNTILRKVFRNLTYLVFVFSMMYVVSHMHMFNGRLPDNPEFANYCSDPEGQLVQVLAEFLLLTPNQESVTKPCPFFVH